MKYSKIKKFIKQETPDFKAISDILLSNYGKILEVYLHSAGQSNYPSIQWINFTDMCKNQVNRINLLNNYSVASPRQKPFPLEDRPTFHSS